MERHSLFHAANSRHYRCPDCHGQRFYSLAKVGDCSVPCFFRCFKPRFHLLLASNFKALKHDRKFHTGVKDYECRVCEAEVTDIAVHMKVHVTEKEFACTHCPASFRHKNSLIRHMCQHTGERPYACQRCSAAFIAPHRLKEHVERCHARAPAAAAVSADRLESEHGRLGDVLGDEESRALVADLMLEGCSDVILTEEKPLPKADDEAPSRISPKRLPSPAAVAAVPDAAAKAKDVEVEIIDEKRPSLFQLPQQQQTLLQPLLLPTVTALQPLQPVVMSLVAGANGQVYLLPSAAAAAPQAQPPPQAAQQPQTIILSSWPTPPSSVSPAASVLSPSSIASPAPVECLEVQVRIDRYLANLHCKRRVFNVGV